MGTLTEAWTAAAVADADAVGVAVDNPDDPHVAVIVHGGHVVYAQASPGIRTLPADDLTATLAAVMLTAIGLWAQQRGGAGGMTMPPLLADPKVRVHATAGMLAMSASGDQTQLMLDLDGVTDTDPAARKAAVAQRVQSVAAELDRLLAGKRTPPASTPTAVLAQRLVARGEKWTGTDGFIPGDGWKALLQGIVADAEAATP